jgi:glutamyl-tRNA synthetase
MQELTELFTVERVHSSPARFDMKKLEAINGDKIRALSPESFFDWAMPFLTRAGVVTGTESEVALVKRALPIIQERIATLSEIPPMLKFLFTEDFHVDADSVAKISDEQSKKVLQVSLDRLTGLSEWKHEAIEGVLRAALIEELGLKPRIAFGAVRIAVTGSHISPPLFESMELLGQAKSMERIEAALEL